MQLNPQMNLEEAFGTTEYDKGSGQKVGNHRRVSPNNVHRPPFAARPLRVKLYDLETA